MAVKIWVGLLLWGMGLAASGQPGKIQTLVIGSCAQQDGDQSYWQQMLAESPDLFLFIGDNIYADGMRYRRLKKEYRKLGRSPGYQAMQDRATVLAIWDDHDFGENDGGASYGNKHHSKRAFLKFFEPPKEDRVWLGPGLYRDYIFGNEGQRVQVILLDTRFFRSPLNALPKDQWGKKGRYLPDTDASKTLLGHGQWTWLEQALAKPADIRFIITSIQAISNEHGWESWGNLPHERTRLLSLMRKTNANGLFLISGDRHAGEISRLPAEDSDGIGYPLYELTASGLNTSMASDGEEPNRYRVGPKYLVNHFGLVSINWDRREVKLALKSTAGLLLQESEPISLDSLQ